MTDHHEPVWTGRYGVARDHVLQHGQDFMIVNYLEDGKKDALPRGVYIFGPGDHPERVGNAIGQFGEDWIDNVIIRAYNSEDAFRNWAGAIAQWHVWYNYPELNWETAPFTNEAGEFPETGGDHGGAGFDAMPPDDTAKDGITRPDLFSAAGGWIAEDFELERAVTAAPKLR